MQMQGESHMLDGEVVCISLFRAAKVRMQAGFSGAVAPVPAAPDGRENANWLCQRDLSID
jgi:hypothetical protein